MFSSPASAPTSPSPSPKKRGRAELEEELLGLDADGDAGMESDDDSVTFVMTPSPSRPIKPLKKLSTPHLNSLAHTILHEQINVASDSADHIVMQIDNHTSEARKGTDIFNEDF